MSLKEVKPPFESDFLDYALVKKGEALNIRSTSVE